MLVLYYGAVYRLNDFCKLKKKNIWEKRIQARFNFFFLNDEKYEIAFQAGANMVPREGDDMTRLPFLRTWFRTRSAIVLHLSNGTLQVIFKNKAPRRWCKG